MEQLDRQKGWVEWPTLAMFAGCYAVWIAATLFHDFLGPFLLVPLLGVVGALNLSLQHEALHGHPTRSRRFNELVAGLPLTLLVPYRRYQALHLTHHNDERITDPILDPESFYVEPGRWAALPAPMRFVLRINNTLIGRLLLGPGLWTASFLASEIRTLFGTGHGARTARTAWALHGLGLAAVVGWVVGVAGMPIWLYVLCAVYPAFMLTMFRTFAEHQAESEPAHRSVIVERAPFLSMLFLNNNLHYLHHKHPTVAWYRLPALFRTQKQHLLRENGGYRFTSYLDIFKAYALRPKEPVPHPLRGAVNSGETS